MSSGFFGDAYECRCETCICNQSLSQRKEKLRDDNRRLKIITIFQKLKPRTD